MLMRCMHAKPLSYGYGICGLEWMEGIGRGRLGLLTAGADGQCFILRTIQEPGINFETGCVRMWDASCAAEDNGAILTRVNHDIAAIALGDRSKGEHRLVV